MASIVGGCILYKYDDIPKYIRKYFKCSYVISLFQRCWYNELRKECNILSLERARETLKHSGTVLSHYILCIGQRVLKYIKMRLYKLNE